MIEDVEDTDGMEWNGMEWNAVAVYTVQYLRTSRTRLLLVLERSARAKRARRSYYPTR